MRMKKLLAGGVCLMLCTAVYAGLSNVQTNLQQADVDSLARLYVSAAPPALFTPVRFTRNASSALAAPRLAGADDSLTAGADARLSEYVKLHKSLVKGLH